MVAGDESMLTDRKACFGQNPSGTTTDLGGPYPGGSFIKTSPDVEMLSYHSCAIWVDSRYFPGGRLIDLLGTNGLDDDPWHTSPFDSQNTLRRRHNPAR